MQKARMNPKTYRLVLSAVMIALATLLSMIQVYSLPMGGSITLFSQVPIIIVSWLFGVPWGLLTGFVMGLIQMIMGASNFGYVSGPLAYTILVLMDYVFPFTFLGLGGIFKKVLKNRELAIGLGGLLVSAIRFVCHFISGITIWGAFASDKTMGAICLYSLTYNGSYMLGEAIITVIGCVLVSRFLLPRLSGEAPQTSVVESDVQELKK